MSHLSTVLVGAFLAAAPVTQEMPANAPHFVHSVKAPGIDVRFLDFKWDPVVFATLEKGGSAPAGRRSWVLARILLTTDPMRWEGTMIPVGPTLLILNPARGSVGPTFELRHVDMRDVFTDMNVVAEPPPDETYKIAPAVFRKAAGTANRLDVSLNTKGAKGNVFELLVHYGDREATLTLTP
jgi:hypothetical protein